MGIPISAMRLSNIFHFRSRETAQNQYILPSDLPQLVVPLFEDEPTVNEWIDAHRPTWEDAVDYFRKIFPFISWLPRYNRHWLFGDVIAGLTVGFVVVPQAMAYAILAHLRPEYGLYTSFMGAAVYWLFGTSKDIVIGTTAVGSLLVGEAVLKVESERPGIYTAEDVAKALSLLSGLILIFLGLFRLGWLIELIPHIPISAFITSASITIIGTQLPVALGIKNIPTREAPYKVYINILKGLGRTELDAAIGLTCLVLLYTLKSIFTLLETRKPNRKRLWTTLNSLRMAFAILLYTFVSWVVHRRLPRGGNKFRLVGHIDRGFKHAGLPRLSGDLLSLVAPSLPSIVIILIIEHVAIAKSFGRQFGYNIDTSQEILAQGSSNALGTLVGGYACTGSFGASAVLSKAGSRTPLASLFGAGILVLSLYVLTAMFYYIPLAALAGLIIHAVANLVATPSTLYRYWRLSPFELLIWVVGVLVAVFVKLETATYVTVALCLAMVLIRMARSEGSFLGQTFVHEVSLTSHDCDKRNNGQESPLTTLPEIEEEGRTVYLSPKTGKRGHAVKLNNPYPGVFVYRFNDALNYINKARVMDHLVNYIKSHTKQTTTEDDALPEDLLWSEPTPTAVLSQPTDLPILRAVILDCSAINNLDVSSIQSLEDARKILAKHAAPMVVQWRFAELHSRWAMKSLAVAGFGFPTQEEYDFYKTHCSSYLMGVCTADCTKEAEATQTQQICDLDDTPGSETGVPEWKKARMAPIYGLDRPFFHVDVQDAVDAAIKCAQATIREDTRAP